MGLGTLVVILAGQLEKIPWDLSRGCASQCKNGHILCGDCQVQRIFTREGRCPTCDIHLDGIRTRALEKVHPHAHASGTQRQRWGGQ